MSDIDRSMVFDLTTKAMYDAQKAHELGLLVKEQLVKDNEVTSVYQAFRRCEDGVFDIMETVVDAIISTWRFDEEYYNEFIERCIGDDFLCDDESVLCTAVFCGNHWNTNSQHINAGSAFRLPAEWIFTRPYNNVNKFILGHIPFDEVLSSIKEDIRKAVNDRVSMCIQNLFETQHIEFNMEGYTRDDFDRFCSQIKHSIGCDYVDIASTKDGVDKLVIKGGTKPIKIHVYDDTRTVDIITSNENGEGGIDLFVQTKLGVGVVVPNVFAHFKLLQ